MQRFRGVRNGLNHRGWLCHQAAFTLIELLIVVAIIAILAAIAVPNFLEAQVRSKAARVKTDLRSLATAMECYRIDNNAYPPDYNSGAIPDVPMPPEGWGAAGEYKTYASLTTPVAYITTTPGDPFMFPLKTVPGGPRKFPYFPFCAYRCSDPACLTPVCPHGAAGVFWGMTSYAPDQKEDNLWMWIAATTPAELAELSRVCYDATNGTRSRGDLGRSNTQSYPAQ